MDDLVKVGNSLIGVASPSNVVHDETLTGNGVTTPLSVVSNETVLWEGEPTLSSDVITCSEDIRNFDKIEVTLKSYSRIYVDTIKVGGDIIAVGNTFVNTDGQYENSLITYQTTDYINYIWKATIHGLHKNALTSAWNSNVIITKIVGIGRKGGN